MKKAFIISKWDSHAHHLFRHFGLELTLDHTKADVIVFSGGTDINPVLYGETRHKATQDPDFRRDVSEQGWFDFAKKNEIPMFGICRGMQFLNVMHGGKLVQHMPDGGHYGQFILDNGVPSTCCHHQAIIPTDDCTVLARFSDELEVVIPEVAWWEKTRCLGVQGHPEWRKSPAFVEYTMALVKLRCLGE